MVIAGTVIGGVCLLYLLILPVPGFSGVPLSYHCLVFNASFRVIVIRSKFNYPVGSSFNTITKDLIGNT